MRLERPKLYLSLSRGSLPFPTVERIRSNISSKIPAKIHRPGRASSNAADSYYNLSYRRPILSDDRVGEWEPSNTERKTTPNVVIRTPKTPTMSTAVMKKPVKKVLSAVISLPSLRGNGSYSSNDTKDYTECRDEDHQYLLSSINEDLSIIYESIKNEEVTEGVRLSSQKGNKKIAAIENDKPLEVVNTATPRPCSDASKRCMRMSTTDSSLVGLKVCTDRERGSDHSEACASISVRTSSVFSYITDANTYVLDDKSFGGLASVDVDSYSPIEQNRKRVSVDNPGNCSKEAGSAECVKNSNESKSCQSYVTYTSEKPATATPSENWDVILLTPIADGVDTTAQANGPKPALFIPVLGSDIQDNRSQTHHALNECANDNLDNVYDNEASPMGVDDFFARQRVFTLGQDHEAVAAKDETDSAQKPLLPLVGEDSASVASGDWNEEDVRVSNSLQPFGYCTIHDGIVYNVLESAVSNSVLSSPKAQSFDYEYDDEGIHKPFPQKQQEDDKFGHGIFDRAADEESKESKESAASLGSFSQIFRKEHLPEDDYSESESDVPGDTFDPESKRDDWVVEAVASDDSDSGDETPGFLRDLVQQKLMLKHDRPWKADSDCDSMSSASDLISVLSASLLSSDSEEDTPPVLHILSGGLDSSGDTSGDELEKSGSEPSTKDFGNLNSFWLHEWTEMAATEDNIDSEANATENESSSDQPNFLVQEEVGDASTEDDPNEVVSTHCDGDNYLKIYDIGSGVDVCGWLHRHNGLETVKECSSKEEGEEASHDEKILTLENPGKSGVELRDLCDSIDEYQSNLKYGCIATQFSSFRRVRSSKNRLIRLKKRAVVKAKSERRKYSLAYLEKGTETPKTGPETYQPSLTLNNSLDGILFKALDALAERENVTHAVEDEELAHWEEGSVATLDAVEERENGTPEGKDEGIDDLKDAYSLASSCVSIDSFASMVNAESEKEIFGDDAEQSEKNGIRDSGSVRSSSSHRPKPKRRNSFIIEKLYDENVELAESLVATQSELEKVNNKLEGMKMERDDAIASARFEI